MMDTPFKVRTIVYRGGDHLVGELWIFGLTYDYDEISVM